MFALPPGGTLTTQNLTLSAPDPTWPLVTPPTPSLVGSIWQGRPVQSPVTHSILIPNVGGVFACQEPVKIGFQLIIENVEPSALVFPPATYGDQLPNGFVPSPQIQASSVL